MENIKPSREVSAYLRGLDAALANVPTDVANEIRSGVTEELISLSPEEAHERIAQLGDARFIAAEAGAGSEFPSAAKPRFIVGSRFYAIAAAIVLVVGAFILPLVGWALGYVLVGLSPVWRRWEKVVAVGVPLGITLLVGGFFAAVGYPAATAAAGNPVAVLLPIVLSNAAIVLAISNAILGVWLLARALVRT